jgi:hypothetical protein
MGEPRALATFADYDGLHAVQARWAKAAVSIIINSDAAPAALNQVCL